MKRTQEVKSFNIPYNLSMYDNLPYSINPDIRKHISLVSGNIIKGYTVNMEEEKRIIDPLDFDPNVIDSHAKEPSSKKISNEATTDNEPDDLASDEEPIDDDVKSEDSEN
ncbi:MAG: hypothetical protein E7262_04085 [Lachnospiraceae bacterium]|nr:hypothetical protein [Lachnospiraceae bacterium]